MLLFLLWACLRLVKPSSGNVWFYFLEAFLGNGQLPVSFIIFKDSRLFKSDASMVDESIEGREEIVSQVIAATVEVQNLTIENLPSNNSIVTRFLTRVSRFIEHGY